MMWGGGLATRGKNDIGLREKKMKEGRGKNEKIAYNTE